MIKNLFKTICFYVKALFSKFTIELNTKYKHINDTDQCPYIYFPVSIEGRKIYYNVFAHNGKEYYFLCTQVTSKYKWKVSFIKYE